ncbi:MAG: replicative DNA helicase [Bacteriovoracaceae bacterium]|nr:replicative DNA helicase [Bacteriovoracaceae bacterium]
MTKQERDGLPKELPHDILAERSLVGCLLVDGQSFDSISELNLFKEDFFHPQYGIIFHAIRELIIENKPIDYITVCSKLSDTGKIDQVGGESSVLTLIEDQASSANIYHYAKIVKDKSTVRSVIRLASKVMEQGMSFEGRTQEFVSEVESQFFNLTSETRTRGLRDLKEFLKTSLRDIENPSRSKGEIGGLPSGYKDLDRKLLGFQPGQLIVLAARPAMGKTSLALNLAVNAAKLTQLPVAIFSLEMLAAELSMRILSSEANVESQKIRTKDFNPSDLKQMSRAVSTLSNLPLYINDAADISLMDIKSQCRKLKVDQGLGLVVIDYLQLMRPNSDNPSREQQIAEISRGLKNLSKELECPIITLSQLNRSVESRVEKRPMLSDLRESGAIEQDADIVLFLYRDEIYNNNTEDKGIAEVIIGKNRGGETGVVKLAWVAAQTKFTPLSYDDNPSFG